MSRSLVRRSRSRGPVASTSPSQRSRIVPWMTVERPGHDRKKGHHHHATSDDLGSDWQASASTPPARGARTFGTWKHAASRSPCPTPDLGAAGQQRVKPRTRNGRAPCPAWPARTPRRARTTSRGGVERRCPRVAGSPEEPELDVCTRGSTGGSIRLLAATAQGGHPGTTQAVHGRHRAAVRRMLRIHDTTSREHDLEVFDRLGEPPGFLPGAMQR